MNSYYRWLNGNQCCCGNNNYVPCTGDNCTCEEIYLHINNLKTDIDVVSGEVGNKLDASAYTPTDLTDYYTKEEVDALIPTVPTNVSAFNNDAGYLTEHQPLKTINGETLVGEGNIVISGDTDLTDYYTKEEVDALIPTVPANVSAFNNDAHYVTSAETANYVTSGNVETQITNHFYCCSEAEWALISGSTQPNVLYLVY